MDRGRVVAGSALVLALGLPSLLAGCGSELPFTQEDYSPDGTLFAVPEGSGVELRRTTDDTRVRRLSGGHGAPVTAAHFSDDGARLVSGDEQGRIVVWDPATGGSLGSLAGHRASIRQFATRKEIPDVASCSDDGTLKLWDLRERREVRTLAGHCGAVTSVAFSTDGRTLVSTSADKTVKLWDVQSGTERRTLTGHAAGVRAADFGGEGLLATGSDDGIIKIWDLKEYRVLRTLEGAKGPVLNLFLTRNGRWVLAYQTFTDRATNRRDAPISIWDLRTGDLAVADYLFEARVAPPDWPFRAVFGEIAQRATHRTR